MQPSGVRRFDDELDGSEMDIFKGVVEGCSIKKWYLRSDQFERDDIGWILVGRWCVTALEDSYKRGDLSQIQFFFKKREAFGAIFPSLFLLDCLPSNHKTSEYLSVHCLSIDGMLHFDLVTFIKSQPNSSKLLTLLITIQINFCSSTWSLPSPA